MHWFLLRRKVGLVRGLSDEFDFLVRLSLFDGDIVRHELLGLFQRVLDEGLHGISDDGLRKDPLSKRFACHERNQREADHHGGGGERSQECTRDRRHHDKSQNQAPPARTRATSLRVQRRTTNIKQKL